MSREEKRAEIDRTMATTGALHSELSINLEKQRVRMPKLSGGTRTVRRTIYRVRWKDGHELIGDVHTIPREGPRGGNWTPYRFDFLRKIWSPIKT